jgi:hypothetical protein
MFYHRQLLALLETRVTSKCAREEYAVTLELDQNVVVKRDDDSVERVEGGRRRGARCVEFMR